MRNILITMTASPSPIPATPHPPIPPTNAERNWKPVTLETLSKANQTYAKMRASIQMWVR